VDDRHILAVVLVAVVQLLGAATGAHGPGPERPAPPLRVYGPPPVAGSAPCMLQLSGERSGPRPALVEAGAITGNGLSAALSAPGLETTPDTLPAGTFMSNGGAHVTAAQALLSPTDFAAPWPTASSATCWASSTTHPPAQRYRAG
jgi:hypothetical protein